MPRVTRRDFAAAIAFGAIARPMAAFGQTNDRTLLARGYEYALPIFEHARLVYQFSYNPDNRQRVPVNRFGHRRVLADHTSRAATTPNNDTLYSSAVIDLSQGTVRLDIPAFGQRYFSVALIDAYTNNFAHIGTGTLGGKAGRYLIAGPQWRGNVPMGVVTISAPSNYIVAIGRIMVDDPGTYDAVHRLQDALVLTPSGPTADRTDLIRPIPGDAENFVAVVNQVLRENPPPAADAPTLEDVRAIGLGAPAVSLSQAQRESWRENFAVLRASMIADSKIVGTQIAGWEYTASDVGNFGTDYRTRAIIALKGIWATTPDEIIYTMASADRSGRPLDGDRQYRLHLPPGAPPARFWSFSIYEATNDGALFFADNPRHRYALGDRTEGLLRNTDGSIDLLIQRLSPGRDHEGNWLPVPAKSFVVIARAYLPEADLYNGRFRYPGIDPAD